MIFFLVFEPSRKWGKHFGGIDTKPPNNGFRCRQWKSKVRLANSVLFVVFLPQQEHIISPDISYSSYSEVEQFREEHRLSIFSTYTYAMILFLVCLLNAPRCERCFEISLMNPGVRCVLDSLDHRQGFVVRPRVFAVRVFVQHARPEQNPSRLRRDRNAQLGKVRSTSFLHFVQVHKGRHDADSLRPFCMVWDVIVVLS